MLGNSARLILLGLLTSVPAAAQFAGTEATTALDVVTWSYEAEPEVIQAGDSTRILFEARLAPGWRMYAPGSPRPTRAVSIAFGALREPILATGPLGHSGSSTGYDPNFDMEVVYFESVARLWSDVVTRESTPSGASEIGGTIEFMVCNDRMCFPPTTTAFSVPVRLVAAADAGASSGLSGAEPPAPAGSQALDFEGFWAFLLLAIGAGFGAFLMPCVYPMIPLTVSYFTKHSERSSEAVRMALVYGLAIVLTFTGLGTAMAALFKGAGAQQVAANPWLNLFIGAVFVVFALSLLGLFELRLPSGLVNFVDRRGRQHSGLIGVLFMGFSLTLVSFSCTVPFVGLLLPAIAGGAWFYGILGMLAFSLSFSLPFVLFALFPRALGALPGAGGWMEALKVVFGFVELVAAIKFLSNADILWGLGLISRPLALAITVSLFALAGMYLIGALRLRNQAEPAVIGVGRLLSGALFFGLALLLLPGLLGAPLGRLDAYLPPRQYTDISLLAPGQLSHDEGWIIDDVDAALAEARSRQRPVMVDFTGYTCTNCRDMEANVFTRPEIARAFEQDFVLLRLYTDGARDRELQRYQLDMTGTVALPTYAILNPDSPEVPLLQLSGTASPERFARFLSEGVFSFRAAQPESDPPV